MTITVKHKFVSAIADSTDTSLVRPTNWNDTHDIVGLGTMAEQNANAVAITGGSINGTTIGATTASTGAFTYISTSSSTNTTPTLSFNASNSPYAAGATISGSYLQHLIQNKSGTAGASTNYVLSNDLGTDSTYYGEFGMNSSTFTASGTFADFYSINNGIYFSGHDGDLSVGSGNGYKLYLTWGTTGQSAHVINASGAIGLSTNLGTSAATTGTSGFGTSGQVLTSAGSSAAPTWTTITSGVSITDDTTTNSTRYPLFTTVTTGNVTTEYVSSTKYQFNPSTGILTATGFAGALNGSVGATTPSTGAFTTLSASSTVSGTGFSTYLASPPAIGGTAPSSIKVTYGYSPNLTLTDAATIAWDTSTGQVATFTFVSTNRTVGAPTNLVNGGFYALSVIQNGGSNTLTWNAVFKWTGGVAPTLSTAASAKDYFVFRSDGTNLYEQGRSLGVA